MAGRFHRDLTTFLAIMKSDSYRHVVDLNWSQEVKMAGEKEKRDCLENGVKYPDGSEDCMDVYCFKCVDGEWETHPSIGVSIDPSEVI